MRRPKALPLILSLLLFGCVLVLFTLVGEAVWLENHGGVIGQAGQALFHRLFGLVGSWIIVGGLIATFTILLAGMSPGDVLSKFKDLLINDWREWRSARLSPPAKREKKPPVVATKIPVQPPVVQAPKPSAPKIMTREEPAPPRPERPRAPVTQSVKETAPAANAPKKPYASPALDIFETMGGNAFHVPKEELRARAALLEQTLANFDIAANVVEIHPGPVITRYDLEPAPGVKVSSIASRADDLALAMKSIGIRVLAPIPGKGAVGVEIPNSSPEPVGLQELLNKPEFMNHKSPLAFVLGKTVSGEPYIADLAKMPHLLIAGATGAGKSVCVHALISSILYRMGPDQVKFTLIDPKRLELPSYAQIPHLYDPRNAPANAEVITNSKQAAKALTRLVKVMEYRYDQFAKASVRNIESYNEKQKAKGLPPEYYLVVIIDELADLMITSPKEVEDSVQRLAQMARAVGIHLVLATQRPSVDVITGVIKANLPARIALRVASSTDSRVIIDTVGADCLLGKGDMLYLPPAQPDPIRIQGAYVSEKEVENLVSHVKQFGLPSYHDLFSSGSALEFAVEDKKEMKDLLEALKLVLERRRVSQDLLKAHFGSSARATNILSLMEVKQFIVKPEGTNRWEINFDMIEEFLTKVGNIPETELMQ
jgi:S-DNA-T family DNA segregation ATPase FtsK/SpoIIIE